MPSYHTAFPSKFLSAAEIDQPYDATIREVATENVGTSEKPEAKLVAAFEEEGRKPVVLNKTRCESLEEITGSDDYERWRGKRVHISKGFTRYGGKRVPCIVISASAGAAPRRAPRPASTLPEPDDPMPMGDEDFEEPF